MESEFTRRRKAQSYSCNSLENVVIILEPRWAQETQQEQQQSAGRGQRTEKQKLEEPRFTVQESRTVGDKMKC